MATTTATATALTQRRKGAKQNSRGTATVARHRELLRRKTATDAKVQQPQKCRVGGAGGGRPSRWRHRIFGGTAVAVAVSVAVAVAVAVAVRKAFSGRCTPRRHESRTIARTLFCGPCRFASVAVLRQSSCSGRCTRTGFFAAVLFCAFAPLRQSRCCSRCSSNLQAAYSIGFPSRSEIMTHTLCVRLL